MSGASLTEGYRMGTPEYGYYPLDWHSFIDAAIVFGSADLQHRCSCEWQPPAGGDWPDPWPWQNVHVHRHARITEILCANCGASIALLEAHNPQEN